MRVIIQSLGFRASAALKEFIHGKLKLIKYDKLVGANVILFKGAENTPNNNYCEIRLEIPGNDVFSKRNSFYFETAISACIEALNETLKRSKSKRIYKRQANATQIQDAMLNGELFTIRSNLLEN